METKQPTHQQQDKLTLYIDFMSQPSRAILSFVKINKIPCSIKVIRLMQGNHLTKDFKQLNPLRKVPVITDGEDFSLSESHAILRYLADSRKVSDHWYPKDLKKRAIVDRYLDWHHLNTRYCHFYYVQANAHLFPQNFVTWEPEDAKKRAYLALKTINDLFLKDNLYLCGFEQPTIADLSAVQEIKQLVMTTMDLSKFSRLQEWMNKMSQIPEVDETMQPLKKFLAKQKQAPML